MAGSWSEVVCLFMGALVALVSAFFGAVLARSLEPKQMIDRLTHPLRHYAAPRVVENQEPITSEDGE